MAYKLEVQNGVVVNVIEVDPENVPEWCAGWPDGVDGATIGWIDVGGRFEPPPVPEMGRDEAVQLITGMIDGAAVVITGVVPEVERLSWTAKEQAARAYVEGRGASDLLIIEAEKTGETIDDLARKIIRNADLYRAAVATMTGLRRAAVEDIQSGESARSVVERVRAELASMTNPQ